MKIYYNWFDSLELAPAPIFTLVTSVLILNLLSFAVVTRVKVSFIDTIVRLEHLPREAKTGAALEFRIGRLVSVVEVKW